MHGRIADRGGRLGAHPVIGQIIGEGTVGIKFFFVDQERDGGSGADDFADAGDVEDGIRAHRSSGEGIGRTEAEEPERTVASAVEDDGAVEESGIDLI